MTKLSMFLLRTDNRNEEPVKSIWHSVINYFKKRQFWVELICTLLIVLWIYTGLNKLLDYSKFTFELGRSPFLENLNKLVAPVIPASELLLAVFLLIRRTRLLALYGSFFLMALFTGYVYVMLHYSYYLPCSCGGVLESLSWDQHLIFNSCFTALAGCGVILHYKLIHQNSNSSISFT